MELCDSLCCLRLELLWVQKNCHPRPRQAHSFYYETATHGFHIVQSNLMYENKGFLSNVVGDFKEQKIFLFFLFFFLSVSFVSFILSSFLSFFLHKKQITRNCGFLCPCCLSLWVCHSTRKKVNQDVSGYCLTWHWFLLESLKKQKNTAYQVRWNLCVWLDVEASPDTLLFLPVHWHNRWVDLYKFFAKSLYFAKCCVLTVDVW